MPSPRAFPRRGGVYLDKSTLSVAVSRVCPGQNEEENAEGSPSHLGIMRFA